jgi:hypothetical protein
MRTKASKWRIQQGRTTAPEQHPGAKRSAGPCAGALTATAHLTWTVVQLTELETVLVPRRATVVCPHAPRWPPRRSLRSFYSGGYSPSCGCLRHETASMPTKGPQSYFCANCDAIYQVSKIEGGDRATNPEVPCLVCGAPFPAHDGAYLLKYFMLRKAARLRRGRLSAALRSKSRTARSSRR